MQNLHSNEGQKKPIILRTFLSGCKILFAPLLLLLRLIEDEFIFKRLNNAILNEGLRHKSSRYRLILIPILMVFCLTQVFIIYAVVNGYGTRGYGNPQAALNMLINKFKIPAVSEIINLWWVVCLFLLSTISHFANHIMFVWSKSKYQTCIRAIESEMGGSLAPEGKKYWYYPEKLLCLYRLRGMVGDDILKRIPLWNSANFFPTPDISKIENENSWIFIGGVKKVSNSTMIYNRYDEWSTIIQDKKRIYNWFLGEYVNRSEYAFRKADVDFSIAFLGQSGSGKTETMKMWMTAWLCMHPSTKLIIVDLKGSGDWDVFGPMCEFGKILKSSKDAMMALMYVDDLMESRRQYMAEKSYNNFLTWASTEKTDVPPVVVIIDEFPQLKGDLKYDMQFTRSGTPANAIYRMMTMGRSYGLWLNIGSQFAGSDIIPSEMNKNIKVRYVLKLGNPSESTYWLDSSCAADLGKTRRLPDGSIDPERGFGFLNAASEFVRSWYTPDYYIEHELRKYDVHVIEGQKYPVKREPQLPQDIQMQIEAMKAEGKGLEALQPYFQKLISEHNQANAKFKVTMEKLRSKEASLPPKEKNISGLLWLPEEPIEAYVGRTSALRKLPRNVQDAATRHYNASVQARSPITAFMSDSIDVDSKTIPPSSNNRPDKPVEKKADDKEPFGEDELSAFLAQYKAEKEKIEKEGKLTKTVTSPRTPSQNKNSTEKDTKVSKTKDKEDRSSKTLNFLENLESKKEE